MPRGFQIFAHGFDRTEEFALLHGKSAHRKIDGRALLEQYQGLQHGRGIFAARERYSHAVAVANHTVAMNGFPNLAQ